MFSDNPVSMFSRTDLKDSGLKDYERSGSMNCPTCGKELYDNGEERFRCPFCGAEGRRFWGCGRRRTRRNAGAALPKAGARTGAHEGQG